MFIDGEKDKEDVHIYNGIKQVAFKNFLLLYDFFFWYRSFKVFIAFVTTSFLFHALLLATGMSDLALDQGLNPHPMHWKEKSPPPEGQGSLKDDFKVSLFGIPWSGYNETGQESQPD